MGSCGKCTKLVYYEDGSSEDFGNCDPHFVECSKCRNIYHPGCSNIKHLSVWSDLGAYRHVWKCYMCITCPSTPADKELNEKIKQLQFGELFNTIKVRFGKNE